MIARIRLVDGDHVRPRGRKVIPIRDRVSRRKSRCGEGDLLLLIDNIADRGDR